MRERISDSGDTPAEWQVFTLQGTKLAEVRGKVIDLGLLPQGTYLARRKGTP